MKYRCTYEYARHFGHPHHRWTVIGARVALDLHITDYAENSQYSGEQYSGGIEIHYRYPPDYMRDDAPSHDQCWLLRCPCWHDGSSLQATEHWIPFWRMALNDHERMFRALEKRLVEVDLKAEPPTAMAKMAVVEEALREAGKEEA